MKVNCKVTVREDGTEVRSVIDCVYCCEKMERSDCNYDYSNLGITYCMWCGTKAEYAVTMRVRKVKHVTQKVVNQVTYTEEEIA